MPDVANGQQSASPTERNGTMTLDMAVAQMRANRESAAAPPPEPAAKVDGGPEVSDQAADAAAKDSPDGGVSDVETVESTVADPGADQVEETDADTKDPGFVIVGEDGEERHVTSAEIAEALRLEPELRADYTKKTQAVAEKARQAEAIAKQYQEHAAQLEAERQQFAKRGEAYDTALKQLNQVVDSEGAKFTNMDWAALKLQDPEGFREAVADYGLWKDKKATVVAEQQRREQEKADLAQRDEQTSIARLHAHVQTKYPQWSDPKLFQRDSEQMDKTALSLGFAPDEVRSTRDPRVWDMMYKAARFDAIEAAQAAARTAQPKTNGQAPEPIRIVRPGAPRPSVRTARATEVAALKAHAVKSGAIGDVYSLMQAQKANQPRR